MTDHIGHECGIAMLRLLQPLEYYKEKYGTALYGVNKLLLLMEKQHNRGQDGAGMAVVKFDPEPGNRYICRYRSVSPNPIQDIFNRIQKRIEETTKRSKSQIDNVKWCKKNLPFAGELLLGHLRYGTFGKNKIEYCHPFFRQNNWMSRNLVIAGNFNLTNVDELFAQLVELGQHPKEMSDTVTILEKIGHFLDDENERLYKHFKEKRISKKEISPLIAKHLDIVRILKNSCKKWDGGYVVAGLLGHGDAFVLRDPAGIRPAYVYRDDEVVVVTSERPAIQTAFNIGHEKIEEVKPGNVLIIKKDGAISQHQVKKPVEQRSCSFERIYFSRGTDVDIYRERMMLGNLVSRKVLETIDCDVENTVFSFIPNTAEVAFYGLVKAVEDYLNDLKCSKIKELGKDADVKEILSKKPRVEKITVKDAKLRTFISDDLHRDDLVAHVYDITYGTIRAGKDNLVVIDDSIVRGTTLKQSILKILDRLQPAKIIIVSSAPQIRYPDCYGIDMAKLGDFVAFRAAIALLKETFRENLIDEVYNKALAQMDFPKDKITNCVKEIYEPFTAGQISDKIAELLKPSDVRAEVKVIYQSIEGLHTACPNHKGDWYFSGNYPTPGGNKVANRAFVNYVEGKNVRAY